MLAWSSGKAVNSANFNYLRHKAVDADKPPIVTPRSMSLPATKERVWRFARRCTDPAWEFVRIESREFEREARQFGLKARAHEAKSRGFGPRGRAFITSWHVNCRVSSILKRLFMLRKTSLLVAGGLLAGGSSTTPNTPYTGTPQLAAYAATAEYPTTEEASTDIQATALVNGKGQTIQIVNASDKNLSQANVWVNKSFVARVNSLPAHSTVALKYDSFYNRQE
jgi:hypothetical protein